MVARWIGMAVACAMVWPSAVNSAAEQSMPSFTIGEKALCSSVICISLAMPSSLLRTTSRVIGSSAAFGFMSIGSGLQRDKQYFVVGDARDPARLDQRGGVGLLDDRRAADFLTGREAVAVVDLGGDELGRAAEQ